MALITKTNTYFEIPATTDPQNNPIKIMQDDKQNIVISQIASVQLASVTVSLSQLNDLIEALQKIKNQKIIRAAQTLE